ncbi:MAG: MBL fold metallo-hydrolase [Endomicrobium sp.]|uniref:MBL fold metallo-hydrolase n=1 Tax=Candidatus Endomicrobiellum cubanum TaxID=3242325 RepID=UPI00283515C4|nr:MBL fold metallo-hydrolase [Endomicrobium sp.]MDR2395171.1 MBL fold metallo-hydrolase [Endomicrobium sp.]
MIKIKKIISGILEVNCYIIYDSDTLHAVIVDPGQDGNKVINEIEKNSLVPEMLINTHGHYDHVLSDDQIRLRFSIPLAIAKEDSYMLTDANKNCSSLVAIPTTVKNAEIFLEDNQEIKLSFTSFKTISTPGHTKGGICLLFDGFLLTGDTLFAGTIGRTDLGGGDYQEMLNSLKRLKELNPSLIIYPGHGSISTLANELKHNPYIASL